MIRPDSEGWLRAVAPAKVNPWLRVGGKRADGYREVDLSLLTLDLVDELWARPAAGGEHSLTIGGPAASDDVPEDETNLVLRAAAAVAREAEQERALEFRLHKRIPSRAGLGGGSADAAAAALLARELLRAPLDTPALAALLGSLGSDCPFFVAAGDTGWGRGRGRGERVEVLSAPASPVWVALVVPDLECPTGAVYAALEGAALDVAAAPLAPPEPPAELFDFGDAPLAATRAALVNDLEAAALSAVPELAVWRAALDGAGAAHFRLSGSGSAFFGIFAAELSAADELVRVERALVERHLAPRLVQVTRVLGRGAHLVPVGP